MRIVNILIGIDETLNAVFGGRPRETVSGTIGRAYLRHEEWAPAAMWIVDHIFGKGHCLKQANLESLRRALGD